MATLEIVVNMWKLFFYVLYKNVTIILIMLIDICFINYLLNIVFFSFIHFVFFYEIDQLFLLFFFFCHKREKKGREYKIIITNFSPRHLCRSLSLDRNIQNKCNQNKNVCHSNIEKQVSCMD